jgi:hypothetical protein
VKKKLVSLIDWLWLEAQLSSPPTIYDTVITNLHQAKDMLRLLIKPYLTICQWQGQGEGGLLTVSYAGLGYAKPFLKDIFFVEEPEEAIIGKAPIWHPSKLTIPSTADITIIEADKHLVHRLPDRNRMLLPFYVYLILEDTEENWDELKSRFHKSIRDDDIRKVRKYGYEYELSRENRYLEMYYYDMYLPTLKAKHGRLASPISLQRSYQHFRYGHLFLVKRDGQYVSGSLSNTRGDSMDWISVGVINADSQLMREGAQGAAVYAMIHWANQNGYKRINFGGCWPYVNEGVFRYKRKWGSAVRLLSHQSKRIWIKVHRNTPAVIEFLRNNPCLIMDKQEELRLLIVTDGLDGPICEAEAKWRKEYLMPGLKDLCLCSSADLLDDSKGILN